MRNSEERRGWAAAGLTIVLWASAFAGIRAALKSFDPGQLSVLRLTIASLALLTFAPVAGVRVPARRDLVPLLAAALTGMAAYQLLLNAGEQSVPAGTASILVATNPVFVAVMAIHFLDERLTPRAWAGIGLAFTGALIIALGQGIGISPSAGALLVLGAAVSLATFFVMQKPLLSRYSSFEMTTYATVGATLMLLPFGASVPNAIAGASAESLAAGAFLGLGASAVGFFAWAYATARLDISRAASSLYLVPAVAIFVAWLWLGELPTLTTVLGGVVAISGVLLTSRGRRALRRTSASTTHIDEPPRTRGAIHGSGAPKPITTAPATGADCAQQVDRPAGGGALDQNHR